MEIERGVIYRHSELGEVLVTNIMKDHHTYDVDCDKGEVGETRVQFTTDWDDYGAMPGSEKTTEATSFAARIDDRRRKLTFKQ